MGLVWGGVVAAPFLTLKQNNMGREKGFIAANRYTEEKENMIADRLRLGESFRLIRFETGVSMKAIQRIKNSLNIVQPPKQLKPKAVTEKVKVKEFNRESSHVTFSHIKWGDSFIYNSF